MINELQSEIINLRAKLESAWEILKLNNTKQSINKLKKESQNPNFWNNPEQARETMQKLSSLEKEIEQWSKFREDLIELEELSELEDIDEEFQKDLTKKLQGLQNQFQKLEFFMLFSNQYDSFNAVVSIHAGAGGTDAQDWAEMLMRMYFRYAEKQNWQVKLVSESQGTEAGIKSVTFFVQGKWAYGYLKLEAGVHRLVRQSPFNSDALRQTSFALVEVIPEIDDTIKIEIKPEDLRIDTFNAGGKGGQSVNTTYSAVRIVHLPTKITVSCQNERSQTQNKETALKILKSRLLQLKEQEMQKEKQELRGEYHSAEWGNQIRSYVLHPYKMVKDLRTEFESSNPDDVLNGNLDDFIEAELKWSKK